MTRLSRAILNPCVVRAIRTVYADKRLSDFDRSHFDTRVARILHVASKTIRDVIQYRTWKSIDFPILEEEPGLARSVAELESLDPFEVDI